MARWIHLLPTACETNESRLESEIKGHSAEDIKVIWERILTFTLKNKYKISKSIAAHSKHFINTSV